MYTHYLRLTQHPIDVMIHSHERQGLRVRVGLRQVDNIVSMRMMRQTQRMGVEPIFYI